jgi:hypothetical protein
MIFLSVGLYVCPLYKLLNSWTSVNETWYHVTWAAPNRLLHKYLPSICVFVCVNRTLSFLGNGR